MNLTSQQFSDINALSDSDLEERLKDDDYRSEMVEYFGEEEYETLRKILTAPPHFALGADIILLPGIMGSELADQKGASGKVWIDPRKLLEEAFTLLLLDASGEKDEILNVCLEAVGVLKKAYFKTKKWLEQQGHTVHTFPYDWRKSINISASQLKDFIEEKAGGDANKQFVFLAHSMGGLVVRRYLDQFQQLAEDRLDKLIMLGTPNYGSYVPPMVMKKMKGNDLIFTIALKTFQFRYMGVQARGIVQSFPGLYEMYPNPTMFKQDDLYQAQYWDESTISEHHLNAALDFQNKLTAKLPKKMFLIANRSSKTVTHIEREQKGSGWNYKFFGAKVGDGTVPFKSAYLRDVPTYETKARHGEIQKDDAVLYAIDDLIKNGKTDRLRPYIPAMSIDEPELEEMSLEEVFLEF